MIHTQYSKQLAVPETYVSYTVFSVPNSRIITTHPTVTYIPNTLLSPIIIFITGINTLISAVLHAHAQNTPSKQVAWQDHERMNQSIVGPFPSRFPSSSLVTLLGAFFAVIYICQEAKIGVLGLAEAVRQLEGLRVDKQSQGVEGRFILNSQLCNNQASAQLERGSLLCWGNPLRKSSPCSVHFQLLRNKTVVLFSLFSNCYSIYFFEFLSWCFSQEAKQYAGKKLFFDQIISFQQCFSYKLFLINLF